VRTACHARGALRASWAAEIIRNTRTLSINTGIGLLALNILVAGLADHCLGLAGLGAGRAVHAVAGVHRPAGHFGGAGVVHAAGCGHGGRIVTIEDVAVSVSGRLDHHTLHAADVAADVAFV
jgi:hypothetical protein